MPYTRRSARGARHEHRRVAVRRRARPRGARPRPARERARARGHGRQSSPRGRERSRALGGASGGRHPGRARVLPGPGGREPDDGDPLPRGRRGGDRPVIRVAAAGDLHVGPDSADAMGEQLRSVADKADLLLIAGDLTKSGETEEAAALAPRLRGLGIQVVAVLGNHDHHSDHPTEIADVLRDVGVAVLEGDGVRVDTPNGSVGVAGVKGFGGGFAGASGAEFGEPEMKAFIRHTKERSEALEAALVALETDVRIALMHYAPVRETLQGEPPEIFPFLGSYLLAEAGDRAGADRAGQVRAHRGVEHGVTPGGVNVRNVAQTVIRRAYAVYAFERPGGGRETAAIGAAADGRGIPPTRPPADS